MGAGAEIIKLLEGGTTQNAIKQKYSWANLASNEREFLFSQAVRWSQDPKGLGLLQFMYMMAWQTDPWDTLRILSLFFGRTDLDKAQKKKTPAEMRRYLDRIRDTLTNAPAADPKVKLYQHFDADYHALAAKLHIELDEVDAAQSDYQAALDRYQTLGLAEKAGVVQRQLASIQSIRSRGLIPAEQLESERLRMQAEFAELEASLESQRQALARMTADRQRIEGDKSSLVQDVQHLRQNYQAGQSRLEALGQTIQDSERLQREKQLKLQEMEASLQFLVALPQAVMAPLWVEVVQLALEEGIVDDFTKQALERLAVKFPEKALPLLSEIAARSPEPYQVDNNRFESAAGDWMGSVAQARALLENNPDGAAEGLVKAWNGFFQSMEANRADGR